MNKLHDLMMSQNFQSKSVKISQNQANGKISQNQTNQNQSKPVKIKQINQTTVKQINQTTRTTY